MHAAAAKLLSSCKHAQDPEGILAPPKGGHIARRSLQKQALEDKELAKQVEVERERARAELQKLRDVSPAGPLHPCWAPTRTKTLGSARQQAQVPTWGCGALCAAQARVEPRTHPDTVQYFLGTERDELEYEAARRRPLLTDDFFAHLSQAIGPRWILQSPVCT